MSPAPGPELSVVIPFYDEQGNILPLFEELLPVLEAAGREYEVVAVDDGSRDATPAELALACQRWPRIRHLRFPENRGQSAAFLAAFRAARGRLVATMDGDRQIDPADLPAMLELLEERGVDFVYGWRRDRRDGLVKRASTCIANSVRNLLTREAIPDTGCPLKVFKREVLESVPPFNGMHRFYITLGHTAGFTSAEMIVVHRRRPHGRSKYGVWNRVFRALRDCLVVRWMQARWVHADAEELESVRGAANAPGADTPEQESSQRQT